jgi:hypothetical protein
MILAAVSKLGPLEVMGPHKAVLSRKQHEIVEFEGDKVSR